MLAKRQEILSKISPRHDLSTGFATKIIHFNDPRLITPEESDKIFYGTLPIMDKFYKEIKKRPQNVSNLQLLGSILFIYFEKCRDVIKNDTKLQDKILKEKIIIFGNGNDIIDFTYEEMFQMIPCDLVTILSIVVVCHRHFQEKKKNYAKLYYISNHIHFCIDEKYIIEYFNSENTKVGKEKIKPHIKIRLDEITVALLAFSMNRQTKKFRIFEIEKTNYVIFQTMYQTMKNVREMSFLDMPFKDTLLNRSLTIPPLPNLYQKRLKNLRNLIKELEKI